MTHTHDFAQPLTWLSPSVCFTQRDPGKMCSVILMTSVHNHHLWPVRTHGQSNQKQFAQQSCLPLVISSLDGSCQVVLAIWGHTHDIAQSTCNTRLRHTHDKAINMTNGLAVTIYSTNLQIHCSRFDYFNQWSAAWFANLTLRSLSQCIHTFRHRASNRLSKYIKRSEGISR